MEALEALRAQAGPCYPGREEVDAWCARLLERAAGVSVQGVFLDDSPLTESFGTGPNTLINRYVRFTASDGRRPFYGYWQPALTGPAPLLVNLPGYGGSITLHPQLSDLGYHVLHISPQGYVTPRGNRSELAGPDGQWPVLDRTARGLPGGYEDWLSDCLLAVRWALTLPDVQPRLSLYGTSQGGGGSLLLASLLGPGQVRCACADLPFLTDFPGSGLEGEAYSLLRPAYGEVPAADFWRRLGFVDTLSHAHRLTMPVMLSAGGEDRVCPAASVERLFAALPGARQYTYLPAQVHTHSRSSMVLFQAWLRLYA